jgi:hypothetical protein
MKLLLLLWKVSLDWLTMTMSSRHSFNPAALT